MVSLLKKKSERGLCSERFCRNMRRRDRLRCHTCDSRRKRARNPMRAAFRALKDHAKARLIPFSLTFHQFRTFALESDYLNRTGLGGHCLTVDRKDNLKGYTARNIQPLTRAQNAIKKARHDEIRMNAGMAWTARYENHD